MKTIMNKTVYRMLFVLLLIGLGGYGISYAQAPASPAKTATGKIGNATVTIQYSSPSVKGRAIWGELVPYGKIWRAGANAATTFETDKDLKVEGKTLPAGKYSLFILPEKSSWTIIFNAEVGQWGIKKGGVANLDRAKDVLTVNVKPKNHAATEGLTYEVNNKGIALLWEKLIVPVKIK